MNHLLALVNAVLRINNKLTNGSELTNGSDLTNRLVIDC